MTDSRNHLTLHYQVVCAIVDDAKSFSEDEVSTVREAILTAVRTLPFLVESCKVEPRWIELHLSVGSSFELGRTMQVLKSVTSRRLHAARGDAARIWASGYAAATIGQELDVAVAAARLCAPPTRRKDTPR